MMSSVPQIPHVLNKPMPVALNPVPKKQSGFTLIELMITVAIVAILATIAYPSYIDQITKTRRGTAKACLLEYVQWAERRYTTELSYIGVTDANLPALSCVTELSGAYTFSTAAASTATTFSLQAVAQGVQATRDAACTPLTVNQAGAQTPATGGCW